MKKPEWIYIRNSLTARDIWEALPHKRNEYFSDLVFKPEMQIYHITTMKKQYKRRKK